MIILHTNHGDIKVTLYADKAPKTVENFLEYVNQGFFDGTIFHRVIPGFVIQGGGFDASMNQKETQDPIENEADNKLNNKKGTLSMARTMDPHSASSQFFINIADNEFLNHQEKTPEGWGYCVFGEVTEGMDVVEKMAKVETSSVNGHENVPVEPLVVEKVEVLDS